MDILALVADERRQVADLVESLTAEQLATPSLCGEWTVKEVAGHLLAAVTTPVWRFLLLTARSGFNVHRASAELSRQVASRPTAELAAELRRHAGFRSRSIGPLAPLTDVQVHAQDIRRPLGLPAALRPERLRPSLDFLVSGRAFGFTPRRRPAGLRFEATDVGWAWGDGPLVRGAGEAVLLALAGRPVALAELDGDGVAVLRDRLAGVSR